MIEIFLIFSLLIILIREILINVRTSRITFLLKSLKNETSGSIKNYCVVIPLFKEEKIIRNTVKYFSKKFPRKKIFYIVTRKEKPNKTFQVLKSLVPPKNILVCPKTTGDKATQLNFAIKKLKKFDYFIFYDADSRPVVKNLLNNDFSIGQQLTLYLSNFKKLNFLMRGSALYQTRWSLGFESNMLTRKKIKYCIGHGLIVKKDVFRKVGLFQEGILTEDILFGYRASLKKIPFRLLDSFDRVDHAPTFKSALIQSSRWFGGKTKMWSLFKLKTSKYNKFLLALELVEIYSWLFSSPLFIFGLIYLVLNPTLYFGVLIFALVLNNSLGYLVTINKINMLKYLNFKVKFCLSDFCGWHLKALSDFLGPLHYIIQKFKQNKDKINLGFVKTPRNL